MLKAQKNLGVYHKTAIDRWLAKKKAQEKGIEDWKKLQNTTAKTRSRIEAHNQ